MEILKRKIHFTLPIVIVFFFLLAIFISVSLFIKIDNIKLSSILSGLVTGFVLSLVQFFFSWFEYLNLQKFKDMKIKDIRPDRDKREFYESLIKNSKKEILVLGVTADRFLDHFADNSSHQDGSKILLTALSRGVIVKILLPKIEHLDQNQATHFPSVQQRLETLNNQYNNLKFKYFNHQPCHSIFLADGECILGPVFPSVLSKNTPSIYVDATSPYAKTYLEYFNSEWERN